MQKLPEKLKRLQKIRSSQEASCRTVATNGYTVRDCCFEAKGNASEAVKLEAGMRLGAAATKEQREEAEKLAQSIYGATAASQNFNAIQAQASPVTALDQRHQQQLAQIEEYKILYPQK
ncbi:hypothetical protein [Mannheimia haemolytica]|uniref:hypothetical protein n=1 Tax=Mannheimia haemolytica TaxID=75985 RepID=UPI001EFF1042|nr:hypothetical protein [Mannheimia haemolytica]